MITQKVIRTYSNDFDHSNIANLNKHLSEGWAVKFVTPITNQEGHTCNDYVIEKHT